MTKKEAIVILRWYRSEKGYMDTNVLDAIDTIIRTCHRDTLNKGDIVLVSEDKINWYKRKFIGVLNGCDTAYLCEFGEIGDKDPAFKDQNWRYIKST